MDDKERDYWHKQYRKQLWRTSVPYSLILLIVLLVLWNIVSC